MTRTAFYRHRSPPVDALPATFDFDRFLSDMAAPLSESQIERGFVASAHAASGGRQPGAVAASAAPLEASVVTEHPTPKPYSVEQADREARCLAVDVLHQCASPKGHIGAHHCMKCDHAWESVARDTFRAATSDADLCWFKKQHNFIELEAAS
jgi:hypothetical protein